MGRVTFEISVSADGYVAGPRATHDVPLGEGGERLHEWVVGLSTWRETHGMEGGEQNADADLLRESVDAAGAYVMGRRMFSGEGGPWGDEPFEGWWGDEPPFRAPVFVVTHHPREPLVKDGGTTFTFVTEGVEAAIEQARDAAGDKDVAIGGGADVARQALAAGLVDEMKLHLVPLLLGGGVRLFEELPSGPVSLEQLRVQSSPAVTHLRYRVVRPTT
jgi:dihydrofolate reductase